MFRVLHLADLHLGYRPELPAPLQEEVCRERDGILKAAVDLALDPGQDIHMVLIAGDLFDNHRPEVSLVEATIRQLARLEAAGIRVVTVPGNHDEITYHDSVYRREARRWPGLLVNAPMPEVVATLELNGTTCHLVAMAYTGGVTRVEGPLEEFPPAGEEGVTLAVFHGSLDWDGGERSLPLDGEALAAAGYDYVALGHIHRGGQKQLGRGVACYAGMVAGKSFADAGVGSWTVVTLGDGPVRVERLPVAVRAWRVVELDATTCREEAELEEELRRLAGEWAPGQGDGGPSLHEGRYAGADGPGSRGDGAVLTRVLLKGTLAFRPDLEGLQARLASLFSYLEIVDASTGFDPGLLEAYAAEPTIRGLFVRRLQEKLAAATGEREADIVRRALWRGLLALEGGREPCRL
ncbi:MAG: DNA repair exonuclease [Moorella sp. (in: Bacteria)]|nr:DNA repair exonuclease [Moorella sp. (in: firmicutes)]